MSLEIIKFVEDNIKNGLKTAIVTLIAKGGSVPGTTGQVMAVSESGKTIGTIGGGQAEFLVINQAVESIKNNNKVFEFDFVLEEKGMICGGSIKGYGTILGYFNNLLIFGAGHVSQKIYNIAKDMDFLITVYDEREEFKQLFLNAVFESMNLQDFVNNYNFNENTYIIICTKGHQLDYLALKESIKHNFKYIGMIGSKKKVKKLLFNLKQDGFSEEIINKVYAPIGINIDNGTPAEIAVSIMSEILQIKNNGNLIHMKNI